ncbi:multiple sugar transport system ATP-binding protein [Kribbella orskensis]|uniref:Multiple sugar transport system ATP-binding protein n=1 Tax=Kribbella orskensis TaxID=2512216 RepID=A0ABY2BL95_9ACTN|nr:MULTISPECIES: ABC transporter ATP-binding protein [Kribbella]TCN39145.1 multiple sugar transport system ATP-binding protein [Kribbella sp. VKM Ac-2500]TCO21792.1 multiple sugar transport system ATP-binding protein [Kribbella orskensis]
MVGIDIEGLATVYPNGVRAVDGLDLSVADGEFFALLGPSGCGKTTLLRTIAGLEPASEGTVRIDSADVTRLEPGKRGVAMVFQDYALFPHMTVSENITYPLKVRRVAPATRTAVAERTSGELSLQGLLERRPGQLSGGQQQRVALARAIASKGKVLLLDEPLSNLDARLRLEARTFLKKLQKDLGITTVFVTHDQAEALALADRIAVMQSGKLRQLGSPREVFARPANTFVANFIGSTPMNLLTGTVASGGSVSIAGGSLPAATGSVPVGAEVTVGVRPEYLTLSIGDVSGPSIRGSVVVAENLGTQSLVSVECDGTLIGVTVPEEHEPDPGATVVLTASESRVLLYDKESGELLARQPAPVG